MKLEIELVPKTSFFSNVRSEVSSADWEMLKKKYNTAAGHKCQICGGRGPKWPVELHERFSYNEISKIQKLEGMISLCPDCHSVKHWGLSRIRGIEDQCIKHFMKVNECGIDFCNTYVVGAFDQWRQRSQHEWKLDLSFLDGLGVKYGKG